MAGLYLASRMARSPPEGPKPFINTSKGWKGMSQVGVLTPEQKERVRNSVHWKLASVPPDVRDSIRRNVTKQFIRLILANDQIAAEVG